MTHFASHGGVKTAYELHGDGPPLLLLHGSGADRHMFDAIAPMLARHFTVIRHDQRDCGETEGPEVSATLSQLAEDSQILLRALGFERAHVFGSSFGGRIAQAIALLFPQAVDHLVLGSTWPLPSALGDLNPDGLARLVTLRRALPDSSAELARLFYPEGFLAARPELLDAFNRAEPTSARSLRRTAAVSSSLDLPIANIAAKTLLIAGDADRIVPAAITMGMSRHIRECRQLLLAGVGHASCVQSPAEVASAIRHFVDGSDLALDEKDAA